MNRRARRAGTSAVRRSSWAWALGAPLRWLGRRSYEVYLTHMFVVMSGFAVFKSLGTPGRGGGDLVVRAGHPGVGAVGRRGGALLLGAMNRLVRRRFGVASY
jgi:hypothetical protein